MPTHTGSNAIPKPVVARAVQEYDPASEMFAADLVMPMLDVQVQDGTLPIVQREDMLRLENTVLNKGSKYGRITFRDEALLFHCVKNGLEAPITDEDRRIYSDMFDCEVVSAKQLVSLMARARENRVAAAIFSAIWTGGGATLYTDVSGSAPWATVDSDVVTTINTASEYVHMNTGLLPNALICNTVNVNRLLANTVIRARFPGATFISRQMLRDNLGAIFGLQYLIECGSVKNSADEGLDHSGAYIWSSSYAMVARVVPPGSGPEVPGLGRTIRWAAMGGGLAYSVSSYRDDSCDSDILKVNNYLDELVLGSAYGHLLKVA